MQPVNYQSEAAFLEEYRPEEFDRPSVAVDVALLTVIDDALHVLVVRRQEHPHKGRWALPGGFVNVDESLDAAAHRVLRDKVGLRGVFIEQLYTFGAPKRDPRMRIISIAYYALLPAAQLEGVVSDDRKLAAVVMAGENGSRVRLELDNKRARAAFDHAAIIGLAAQRLRGKLNYAPIGYELLDPEFTLFELQRIHEAVLGQPINKDSFRRRMLAGGELEPTGKRERGVGHRPAALYRRVVETGS